MEWKDSIFQLRRSLGLSQEEFAQQLFVTRQAVSRWETGETTPGIDTLKRIAETFGVSTDALLGHSPPLCQSCGMALLQDRDRGTEVDGSRSSSYCAFCYQGGSFTRELTLEEMVESNLQDLEHWNRANGLHLTQEEARQGLKDFLPTLRRWRCCSSPRSGSEE